MNNIKKFVKWALQRTGYTIRKLHVAVNPQHERQITPKHFFDLYFSSIRPSEFFFVEIGANDGHFVDLLHEYVSRLRLSGIVVEPQKDVFERLKKTYTNINNVTCVNAAIATETGQRILYTVKEELKQGEMFSRVTGIASFNRALLKKSLLHEFAKNNLPEKIPFVEDYIEETPVDTLSLADLLDTHGVKRIDFLQIDCEGYDYEIIKMIDFKTTRPKIINYESTHLTPADRAECEKLLESKGYQIFRHRFDTCAFIAPSVPNPF